MRSDTIKSKQYVLTKLFSANAFTDDASVDLWEVHTASPALAVAKTIRDCRQHLVTTDFGGPKVETDDAGTGTAQMRVIQLGMNLRITQLVGPAGIEPATLGWQDNN